MMKNDHFENSSIGTLGTEKSIAFAAYRELKKLVDKVPKHKRKSSTILNRSSSMNLS